MEKTLPSDFLWGAGTSSYQVEGGIENCDWAKAAKEGIVPECGRACDHYNKYEEDFDIVASLGHNAHRLSIEWSRIEPEEDVFDVEAIEHYRKVLKALHDRGITPLVTLHHFTLPIWFSESGGWKRRDAHKRFTKYCIHVVQELGDLCDNYATMNEPMLLALLGYIEGRWAPFYRHSYFSFLRAIKNIIRAHNMAYEFIKKKNLEKQVGIVKHTIAYSSNGNVIYSVYAWLSNFLWTHIFMIMVFRKCDWIGLNYYHRRMFGDTRKLEKTDMNWNADPEGIYDALRILSRYNLPIYITEAGCADAKDKIRSSYIRGLVEGTQKAVRDGIDVRGFFYWSFIDNYEWADGFPMRFGLVEVDYDTLERTVRPSAYAFRDIIKSYRK